MESWERQKEKKGAGRSRGWGTRSEGVETGWSTEGDERWELWGGRVGKRDRVEKGTEVGGADGRRMERCVEGGSADNGRGRELREERVILWWGAEVGGGVEKHSYGREWKGREAGINKGGKAMRGWGKRACRSREERGGNLGGREKGVGEVEERGREKQGVGEE